MIVYPVQALPDGRKMLNVGCGNRYHPQWTNIDHITNTPDVIAHDITSTLPFDENTFDVVYHSHVLEHMQPENANTLLRECYRTLKPSGILRILVPDLEFSVRLYLQTLSDVIDNPSQVTAEHHQWGLLNLIDQMVRIESGGNMAKFIQQESLHDIDFIVENGGGNTILEIHKAYNQKAAREKTTLPFHKKIIPWLKYRIFKRGSQSDTEKFLRFRQTGEVHQWMYDRYSLRVTLANCGFTNLTHLDIYKSQIKNWADFHLDVDPDGQIHKPHSLVYEGTK